MTTHYSTVSKKLLKPARGWVPVAIVLLIATFLRFYQIGTESLWVDEFHSFRDTANLSLNPSRILYFALLRVWMMFGTSDAWLRGLSAIFGVGCVFLIYQLGYRLVGRTTGLLSAFMLAVSPLFIHHSQEVRMYMLSTFLTMGGTLALISAFERVTTTTLGLWAIARILAVFTTPLNVLMFLPDGVLIFLRFRNQRRIFLTIGASISVAVIAFVGFLVIQGSPFIRAALRFFSSVKDRVPGFAEVIGQLPAATVYWPMQQLPSNMLWFYGIYSLISLFTLGMLFFKKARSARLTWLAVWAFLPLGVLLICSYTVGYLWSPRYLLLSIPYLLVLLAAGFVQLWQWRRAVAAVVALVYAVALAGGLFHYYGENNRTDWRSAVQQINAAEQPGDVVVVPSSFIRDRVFARYYSGSAPIYLVPELRFTKNTEQPVIEQTLDQLPTASRIWLLYERADNKTGRQQNQLLQDEANKQFIVQNHQVFSGYLDTLDLFLLTSRSGN